MESLWKFKIPTKSSGQSSTIQCIRWQQRLRHAYRKSVTRCTEAEIHRARRSCRWNSHNEQGKHNLAKHDSLINFNFLFQKYEEWKDGLPDMAWLNEVFPDNQQWQNFSNGVISLIPKIRDAVEIGELHHPRHHPAIDYFDRKYF